MKPTDIGKGWGEEEVHVNYIFDKLTEKGINLDEDGANMLNKIVTEFNKNIDKNIDGIISKEEIGNINDSNSSKYINKDNNGNIIDTYVLDWIVNKFVAELKKEEE